MFSFSIYFPIEAQKTKLNAPFQRLIEFSQASDVV
jgi:hypothetical protein